MCQVSDQDVLALKEWLAKEPQLPNNFEDIVLKKFLFSCDSDLEKVKKCVEKFCTNRLKFPEAYSKRDPMLPGLQNAFSITRVTTYRAENNEILIHQLIDTSPEKFNFYDGVKTFAMHADNWLRQHVDPLPESHIIILDIKLYSLLLLPRINLFYYQKFLTHLIESMPVRLKQVHAVNCPSLYEIMYNIIKPVLPQDIKNLVKFHPDAEGLHQYIDKKYLPKEYGGDAESMEEQNARWINSIQGKRDFYLNDEQWKAKVDKNKKTVEKVESVNSSFNAMAID